MEPRLTQLLMKARNGDPEAADGLFRALYDELRVLARSQLRRGSGQGTLQTTALVHEAYLKLCHQPSLEVRDRDHFFALAARVMRQVLVDHFRRRSTSKRGGDRIHVSFEDGDVPVENRGEVILDLDRALTRLAEIDPRPAQVVECRFFGGMTEKAIAGVLGVTERTVRNDWVKAKAWLAEALAPE